MVTMDEELKAFLAERDDMFRNPTAEKAMAYVEKLEGRPPPVGSPLPLAMVHKARLQWLEATDAMLEESKQWLLARGFLTTCKGAPPLTPEQRDKDRAEIGLPPLTMDS
jgi:hypothetical protein